MFSKLEKLYMQLDGDGVSVVNWNFESSTKALYVTDEQTISAIAVDHKAITSPAEELCIIAEELAHHQTKTYYEITSDFNSPLELQNRLIAETRAQKFSVHKCVSFEELLAVINEASYQDDEELAQQLGVPVHFLDRVMSVYGGKLGLY